MPAESKSLGQISACLYKDENDIALFLQIKQGNRLAFNTLFLTYYEPLCNFASRYVTNPQDAEEIVSDVFIRLWKNAATLEIKANVRAYLFTSVRYGALAVINKAKSSFVDLDRIEDIEDVQEEHSHKRITDIYNAIDHLPPRCREVFIMCRIDELKQKEVAQVLGVAEKTIENHLVKAMAMLRAMLNPNQPGSADKLSVTKV